MSGVEGRWEDGSGGTGHVQVVADGAEFARHQAAYRTYVEHAEACPNCVDGVCPAARRLWRVVKGREEPVG